MGESHLRTLKLKLRVVGDDREKSWKRLRQISADTWRAANWIASGQYLNDQWIRRVYARLKIDPKDLEAVGKIEAEMFSKEGFFTTKRQATTERDIKHKFPDLPSCVTNTLNHVVFASYKKDKPDMLMGLRSLRSYRRGLPVPTAKASVEIGGQDGRHAVTWKLARGERISFEVVYGRDGANNRLTVQRILDGPNDYSAPSIQLNDRGLFLLLPVREPQKERKLDASLAVGVDRGVSVPAYVTLSEGDPCQAIGSAEDFLKTRLQMQSRRRRLQRGLAAARGGHGRGRRMKALDRLKQKERQFARSYNHFISRRVVDFALRCGAGVIKLEMLEGFGEEEAQAFVLRNWSCFELQQQIQYKATRNGIKVVFVDPYHTSQTCSECGNYAPGQRKSRVSFVCSKCGVEMHADHNAARNIAASDRIVKGREQCEIWKQRQESDRSNAQVGPAGPAAEG